MKVLRILIAEDNRADVLLVRKALNEHEIKHHLHVLEDGEEAIRFVTQMGKPGGAPCPDLMLLDLNLPRADGEQVLSELRSNGTCSAMPVIVVTSSDDARDRARMAQLGIARYFRKPVQLDEFMRLGAVVREVAQY